MAWDYAGLSHLAKMNGGPAALINTIEQASMAAGRRQMIPAVAGALALGAGGTVLVQKIKEFLDGKAKTSAEEVLAAKEELVAGIEAYDREHTDEDTATNRESETSDE